MDKKPEEPIIDIPVGEETNASTLWKLRFTVGVIMLCLAFIGMLFSSLRADGGWVYWRIMTPVYALLCIGLSLGVRRKKTSATFSITIWHEVFHWLGFLVTVYLVTLLVPVFLTTFLGGLVILLLLALATFLAGIYSEPTFIVIGIAMGLLVAGVSIIGYVLLPIIVVSVGIMFWLSRRRTKTTP